MTYFLTFSRCPITKEDVWKQLRHCTVKKVKWCVIAQEQHKDGHPHIHVLIRYESCLSVRSPSFFNVKDNKKEYQANIQGPKSEASVYSYITKEDDNAFHYPDKNIDVAIAASKGREVSSKESKSDEIAKAIVNDKKSFHDIFTLQPGFAMHNKSKIDALIGFRQHNLTTTPTEQWRPLLYRGSHVSTAQLVSWANGNIHIRREFKQQQLFIHGPPNSLKTSFCRLLATRLHVYWPPHEDYFDGYDDSLHNLIVFDEFSPKDRPNHVLNTILEGNTCWLKARYALRFKVKPTPCIICANDSLELLYANNNTAVQALRARLLEIHLTGGEDIVDIENIAWATEEEMLTLPQDNTSSNSNNKD